MKSNVQRLTGRGTHVPRQQFANNSLQCQQPKRRQGYTARQYFFHNSFSKLFLTYTPLYKIEKIYKKRLHNTKIYIHRSFFKHFVNNSLQYKIALICRKLQRKYAGQTYSLSQLINSLYTYGISTERKVPIIRKLTGSPEMFSLRLMLPGSSPV